MRTRPVIWLIVIFAAGLSHAQITTTTLLGTVTDPTGASVAGAQITVTHTGTNQVRSVKSDAEGANREIPQTTMKRPFFMRSHCLPLRPPRTGRM
jgi:hypothetical protein